MLASRRRRRILFSAAAAEKMFGLAELAGYPPKFLLSQPIYTVSTKKRPP